MKIELLSRIEKFIKQSFEGDRASKLCYHNLRHTHEVVANCSEIASMIQVDEEDKLLLLIAAWFHDLGHLFGEMQGHEERGAKFMMRFLGSDLHKRDKARVAQLILATQYPPNPANLLEEIICDADTYHFGTPEFQRTDLLVHKEMELRMGHPIPDWTHRSLDMLRHHQFFTGYCKQMLHAGKEENVRWLLERLGN